MYIILYIYNVFLASRPDPIAKTLKQIYNTNAILCIEYPVNKN